MNAREQVMLEAIVAAPADDAPRLAYADWLVARGDARGELIRVECERERLHNDGNVLDPKRWQERVARDEELLRAHRDEWQAPLAKTGLTFGWSRGFPSSIIGGGDELVAARRALEFAPIDSLTLVADLKPTIGEIAASPLLARVLELALDAGTRDNRATSQWALGDAGLAMLARSPHLTCLRSFHSGWNDVGIAGLVALAEAAWLPGLTALVLRDNPLAPDGVAALARAPRLERLRRLDLSGGDVGDAGAAALAQAGLRAVEWLRLSNARIGEAGARALAESPSLGAVTMLELSENLVGDAGAIALARSPHLGALVELRLSGASVGDDGAIAIAGSAERAGLETLALANNRVAAAGARALAGSTTLQRLRALDLRSNQLGVEGVSAFVDGAGLPSLAELGVSDNIDSGETEDWVDWNGAVVGSGPAREPYRDLAARFAARPTLKIN